MKMPRTSAAVAAFAIAAFAVAVHAAPIDDAAAVAAGKQTARRYCSDCHGATGNPTSSTYPRIAGQPIPYLIKQLHEFQAHHRVDEAAKYMFPEAGRLNDEQMHDVAVYFSAQKAGHGAAPGEEVVKAGSKIFRSGIQEKGVPACAQCHGDHGQGSADAEAPRLAGQWSAYLAAQLKVFSTEQRPVAVAMHAIVPLLSAEDIDVLAQYLQSLQTD